MILQALAAIWQFSPYEVGYSGYGEGRNDFDYDDYDGYHYGGDYYKKRRRPHKAPREEEFDDAYDSYDSWKRSSSIKESELGARMMNVNVGLSDAVGNAMKLIS